MTKVKRKEVRKTVADAVQQSLTQFEIPPVSKKMKKVIQSASKKIGDQVKTELKKKSKKTEKTNSTPEKTNKKEM